MNRRRFCVAMGATLSSLVPMRQTLANRPDVHDMESRCFGSSVRFTILHESKSVAQAAMQAALDRLQQVESIMSVYRADSQLSRLNRDGLLKSPHPMLVDLLRQAQRFSLETDSAFDITVQPLWQLFSHSAQSGTLPSETEIEAAQRRVGFRNVVVDDDVIQLKNNAAITLNGIAQGFATDQAKQIMLDHGIQHALLDLGELTGLGKKADAQAWHAGIQHPRVEDAFSAVVPVEDRALATSGDYQTAFTHDFQHHHIFDPATGQSPTQLSSVTVVAPTATEADALSTALMVMGLPRGERLLTRRRHVDAMFVTKGGRTLVTSGFPKGPPHDE